MCIDLLYRQTEKNDCGYKRLKRQRYEMKSQYIISHRCVYVYIYNNLQKIYYKNDKREGRWYLRNNLNSGIYFKRFANAIHSM